MVQLRLCIAFPLFVPLIGANFSQKAYSKPGVPAKPGSEVTTSASDAISDWRMPRTLSKWGVAMVSGWLEDSDPVLFWRVAHQIERGKREEQERKPPVHGERDGD